MTDRTPLPVIPTPDAAPEPGPSLLDRLASRRTFLGFGLSIAAGAAGAGGLAQLFPVFASDEPDPEPIVPVYDPETVAWTFVVDTERCIGCGQCVRACKAENHIPEEPKYTRTWIERHTTTTDGRRVIDSPEGGFAGFPDLPETGGIESADQVEDAYFVPRLCMQCSDSPCTQVCPIGATYRTAEGVILVDSERCIGCGYCVTACPYGARYIVPANQASPRGIPGIADKCTWCYHRLARGLKPACVEVCPVGARRFGDMNDPADPIVALVEERAPQPLWPQYGTKPRVLYIGKVTEEA